MQECFFGGSFKDKAPASLDEALAAPVTVSYAVLAATSEQYAAGFMGGWAVELQGAA